MHIEGFDDIETSFSMHRLDETMWGIELNKGALCTGEGSVEVRILTPGFKDRGNDYSLACRVAEFLSTYEGDPLKVALDLTNLPAPNTELQKKWKMEDITFKWYQDLQSYPFSHNNTDFNALKVRVVQISLDSFTDRVLASIKSWFGWGGNSQRTTLRLPWDGGASFLKEGAFKDPFTKLATQALQTDETPFVSEKTCAGSYHFVLRNGMLELEPISAALGETTYQESRDAVKAYRDYLRRAFGWGIIDNSYRQASYEMRNYPYLFTHNQSISKEEQFFDYLKWTFGIDFDDILTNGSPLLPDHVFKCNIAANNVEMKMAESLFMRLKCLNAHNFSTNQSLDTIDKFYAFLEKLGKATSFSLKEIRGMYLSFQNFAGTKQLSSQTFKEYLNSFGYLKNLQGSQLGETVRNISPRAFHQLMEVLFVDSGVITPLESAEDLFTGRKITHLGITGYKTMGDRSSSDPCRNLSELLQVFPTMRLGSKEIQNELLAHVVAKKALWSHFSNRYGSSDCTRAKDKADPFDTDIPKSERRMGKLIPFPEKDGTTQWYYVDGFLNDRHGDVNYVLIPACKGYRADNSPMLDDFSREKRPPIIKLYRSTASDREAESWADSLMADVYPEAVGSTDFNAGDSYESLYFARCTMPVWTAYLVTGDIKNAAHSFEETVLKYPIESSSKEAGDMSYLTSFVAWQAGLNVNQARDLLAKFEKKIKEKDPQFQLEGFLKTHPKGSEWSHDKIAQDIEFIGHSLGGALSQAGLYHFGPEAQRLPLKGCNYICYAYDSPGGMREADGKKFLDFGSTHQSLLKALGQRWEIHYQFEKQDQVPVGGPTLLGTAATREDVWLDVQSRRYEPLPSARDLVVTTMPIHGRRFQQAKEGIDYKKSDVTIQELYKLKHAIYLSEEERAAWGLGTIGPLVKEAARKAVGGAIAYPVLWIVKEIADYSAPERYELDKEGVLNCNYKGYFEQEEEAGDAFVPVCGLTAPAG